MMGNYHVRFGGQGNQSTDPYSLLAICLIIQLISGVTLAIDFSYGFHITMFYPVEYQDTIAYSILPGTNGLSYPLKLKNKIIHMKYNKLKSTGEFYE